MKKLYTDAGYHWQNTDKTETGKPIMGRICVADDDGFVLVEHAGIGKVPVLKQYINVFELIAIARAIEIAIEKGWTGSLAIHTDSKVAMIWASNGIKASVKTEAHENAYEYLKTARRNYIGVVTFNHVPRDYNPAGKVLEIELEKDKQQRIESSSYEEQEEGGPINRGNIILDPLADAEATL